VQQQGYPPQAPAPPPSYNHSQVAQQPQEAAQVHVVNLSKSPSNGKLINNPSICRLSPEQRDEEQAKIICGPVNYIKLVKQTTARATMRTIPSTPQLADQLGLPIGVTVRPLADEAVPLVDFANVGQDCPVVRCKRCRSYINPFCAFSEHGRKWGCALCKALNEVPPGYYSPLNPQTGMREDLSNRPELTHASIEFVAPVEYMVRPPQRPVFLFLIDVSYSATSSGMLKAQCSGILSALEALREDDSMHISVIAFDSTIYLFNLRSTLQSAKMIVAPDLVADVVAIKDDSALEAVELPALAEDLIVSVRDSYHLLVPLFERLPTMFAGSKNVECAFGPALTTAISLLSKCGGKIVASLAGLPSVGDGKLSNRNDRKLYHQPKEFVLSTPGNDWYKNRALACSQSQISVDLLVNGNAEVELPTIAPIVRYTSGHIYRFSPQLSGATAFKMQVERILLRNTAFEAVLRIRSSTSISVPNFFGHCYVRGPDLLTLPITDADTAYAIQMQLTAPITSSCVYLQLALLYTTSTRERRLRVHTLQINVTNFMTKVFNSFDPVAMSSFLAKMCVDFSVTNAFQTAQQRVNEKLIAMLRMFKKQVSPSGPNAPRPYGSQLILPESLCYLPALLTGIFRAAATRYITSLDTLPDDRVSSMSVIMTAPPDALLSYWAGWTLLAYTPNADSLASLPMQQLSTIETFRADSIYIIDLGFMIAVWYGKSIDGRVLHEFGIPSEQRTSTFSSDAVLSNEVELAELAQRFHATLEKLQSLSLSAAAAPVVYCQQGSSVALERLISSLLVEDDAKDTLGLLSYISTLQRKLAVE
jgi:protein transport protein SEC24